jgi:raffinose/stachyose/melibiose transport system permease protein
MTQPASAPAPAPPATPPAEEGGPARWRERSRRQLPYAVFLIPGGLLLLVVIIIPAVANVGISLTEWDGVGDPEFTGFDNYRELLGDGAFWASFRHNIAVTLAMAVIPTFTGLVLAAGLVDYIGRRFGPRTASLLRACIYLPQVLPIAVAGIVWSWILAPDNGALNAMLGAVGPESLEKDWLGDSAWALYSVMAVMVWVQIGFPLVVFMAGLQRVDPALYEAAEIDGASWWRRFFHITVPQIRPEIFVALLWCTIASLKAFAFIYVLTKGGPGDATNVPSYYSFENFFDNTRVGYGAAVATVLAVLIIGLLVVFLRRQSKAEEL